MKLKKIMALILSGVMAVSMLAGCCGGSGSGGSGSSKATEPLDAKVVAGYSSSITKTVSNSQTADGIFQGALQILKEQIDTSTFGEAGAIIEITKTTNFDSATKTETKTPKAEAVAYITIDELKKAGKPEIFVDREETEISCTDEEETNSDSQEIQISISPEKEITTVSEYMGELSAYMLTFFDEFYDGQYEAHLKAEIAKSQDGKDCWAVAIVIMPKTESAN